ncbi:phage tail protein [Roseomonas chloroacetimidivorans]|uniref:phage tail protein n=1 Tax=Roseomonas chloroacetimidivorans TaxID=1766656 RepID=UPI003C755A9A
MAIYQDGTLNTAALSVPGLYINLINPTNLLLNGVPTSRVGIVGVASWGPVGVPLPLSDYAGQVREFGPLAARAFDLGTAVYIASQQGSQDIRAVRATDGTDAAASATIGTNGLTATAKWTGTGGNAISVILSAGSAANSWRTTVVQAGYGRLPEIFDNITGTGNALWVNIAAAINNGIPGQRSASDLIVATAGAGTGAPVAGTTTLTGGTDGASGVDAAAMIGSDAVPRKGMYALRKTGCSVGMLADVTDSTTYATQLAFAQSEGIYIMLGAPAGQTVSAAATAKTTAGIDNKNVKVILGDWAYWNDPVTGIVRMVSPQAIFAGRLGALAPHQSGLNKEVYGVVATQRSLTGAPYSDAELQVLALNNIDVITNPVPGGAYWGIRMGRNASSSATEHGDNATRMSNFIAATLDAGMGRFVGEVTSDASLRRTEATLGAFLGTLKGTGNDDQMIEDFSVVCRASNNPPARRALGYRTASVKVRYLAITEFFVISLEGGQAVTIQRQPSA